MVVDNLLRNFNTRDHAPTYSDSYCFYTDRTEVVANGDGIFDLTIELPTRSFVNAIIVLQPRFNYECRDDTTCTETLSLSQWLIWNYDIYVGESENYWENSRCELSPYLPDDTVLTVGDTGQEIWCDRAGQYVSVVRDYSTWT